MSRRSSTILFPDPDSSLEEEEDQDSFSVVEETYSMKYTTASFGELTNPNVTAVKREVDASFLRTNFTPPTTRQQHEVTLKYFSPEPCQIPEIVVVPPSTDRKRLRRSSRTPSRTERILMSKFRASRGVLATPLRTVGEEAASQSKQQDNSINRTFDSPKTTKEKVTEKKESALFKRKEERSVSLRSPRERRLSKSLEKKHPLTLLSPRNRSISRKSPASTAKMSTKKIEAIILDMKVRNSTTVASAIPPPLLIKDKLLKDNNKTFNMSSNLNKFNSPRMIALKKLTPSRPVAKISPFKDKMVAKDDPPSPCPSIRGVRLNRRFELMMKYRNNHPN